ncbi:MAG: 5-formyltetrahydrofolate cyclo-ligase [Bacteroidetes bacterium]|nr:5-formyltetrahydrofolate cyclo-ligase [Bacteroidota bacterium]
MDELAAQKSRLRTEFRVQRLALSDEAFAQASAQIVSHLLALPELRDADTVLAFAPLLDRREPDLRPLLHALHDAGKAVALPFVTAFHPPAMAFRRWTPDSDSLDAAGLPSADGPAISRVEAAVVPALAADRRGVRLGYGKGFYDRFLADFTGFAVCPVFDSAFVDDLPADSHDVPVHAVVTESTVWRVPS